MMKKFRNDLKTVLTVLLFFTFFAVSSAKPQYKIEKLEIFAQVQKDGSVDVTELAEYNARSINGILYNIDAEGYGELENLQVFFEENGKYYSGTNQRGTSKGFYTVKEDDGLYKIKLYYPLKNEKKHFGVMYTLPQGVSVYRDTAQFNRKMVGKEWQSHIDEIIVQIRLPERISEEKISAFGHGSLSGNVEIANGQNIIYTIENYRPGEFVETNILFPKELIPDTNKKFIKNENRLKKIMAMEEKLADEANRERDKAVKTAWLGDIAFILITAWIVFVTGFAYVKNRKRHKVKNEYRGYFKGIPDDYLPAVAGSLVSRGVKPRHLLATVMDLARRNILEVLEEKFIDDRGREKTKTVLKKTGNSDGLNSYEKFVLEWYIDELGDGAQVVMEDVEEYISNSRNAREFNKNYIEWSSLIKKEMEEKGLGYEKKKKLPVFLSVVTFFPMFPLGVILAGIFDTGRFTVFSFISIPLLAFTLGGRRYNLFTEQACARWNAFKKFLMNYGGLKEAELSSAYLWDYYLVYAVALGVAEKIAEGYKKTPLFRNDETNMRMYRRSSLMDMYMYSRAFRSVSNSTYGAAERSIRETAKSRHSSGSGRGGGFSSGSSGGGGGRGGGGAF